MKLRPYMQLRFRDVEQRERAVAAAAGGGVSLNEFVVGAVERELSSGGSRSASTRGGELPVAYVSRASLANASIGAKIHPRGGNPAQEPASTQSGTESKTYEKGCPHRFSEPCDDCKKGKKA